MGSDKEKNLSAAYKMRRQAEEKLRAKTTDQHPPRTEGEARRLVHELEVHQIELEMQNEELRRVQQELESERNKFAELYDFAPVGYFTFDERGLIREVNLTGAQLLGIERRQLVNKPFIHFVADEDNKGIFSSHLESVLQNQGIQPCEIRLTKKDGAVMYGQLQSVRVDIAEKKDGHIFTSIVDCTISRQFKKNLQNINEQLESTVQERTAELARSNAELLQEIQEHKKAEARLHSALEKIKELSARVQAENVNLQQALIMGDGYGDIIGQSNAIEYVFFRVDQVASQNTTVLLLGETGTGKGMVAREIHRRSSRKDRPMITVNCTALPANLIESELFGREKGAFTGAHASQMGRFDLADGGTIFLDEIGEMPLELQVKLLRVLQDGEFERLGSPRSRRVDVRIIAASNRKLELEISAGRFREDLFYRLSVFPITIPPLRQRKEDIPLLVNHFVAKFNKKIGRKITSIAEETLKDLLEYQWPGNVRELESVIERAVITSQGPILQISDKFETLLKPGLQDAQEVKALSQLEREHIFQVLQKTNWRVEGKNGAAVILGLNPSTLRARMRKYGIRRQ